MGPFLYTEFFAHGVGLDFYELVDATNDVSSFSSEILITAVLLPERAAIKTSSYQNARLAEPPITKMPRKSARGSSRSQSTRR